jgi:hypothetical protein
MLVGRNQLSDVTSSSLKILKWYESENRLKLYPMKRPKITVMSTLRQQMSTMIGLDSFVGERDNIYNRKVYLYQNKIYNNYMARA